MRRVSFVLPPVATGDGMAACLDSLFSQTWSNVEVLVFPNAHSVRVRLDRASRDSRIVTVDDGGSNDGMPRLLNRAVEQSTGDTLFFVAECLEFAPQFTETFLDKLFGRGAGAWVYGRFYESSGSATPRLRDVRTDRSDFSEGSQVGPVRGIRRDCLEAVGCYDEGLAYAFEYDLRLRIFDRYETVRIDEPLYTAHPGSGDMAVTPSLQMEHYRCYAGAGRTRSYLDYTEAEEREFRAACCRSLMRRGALLEAPVHPREYVDSGASAEPVTVIIPLWNREEYIGPALESVLQSRSCNFQIVVVDNGSTDGSIGIVDDYRRNGPVRLIRNDSNNIARALNIGIRATAGKYVCQLDSDDLYTPDTLRVLVDHMEKHPHAALGVSYYDCIGPHGTPLADGRVVKHLEYDRNNLMRTDGLGAARIWRRCALEELGGFDETLGNYAEDYDLQLKLSERNEILRIPHVLYHYRTGHKKPSETLDYAERHRKKTRARQAALERRRRLNKRG